MHFPDKLKQRPLLLKLVLFVCAEVTFVYFASQCMSLLIQNSEFFDPVEHCEKSQLKG